MSYMVIGASVFILISLALAWLATAVRIMQVPHSRPIFLQVKISSSRTLIIY